MSNIFNSRFNDNETPLNAENLNAILDACNAKYVKPAVGIPKTDLAEAVKSSLTAAENAAPKTSPALTGMPTAPTAATTTNSTQIAITAFVQSVVSAAIGQALQGSY